MKKNILLVIALFVALTTGAVAQIPTTFNLQGYVADNDGIAIATDNISITLEI
jgi:hypothetical protein